MSGKNEQGKMDVTQKNGTEHTLLQQYLCDTREHKHRSKSAQLPSRAHFPRTIALIIVITYYSLQCTSSSAFRELKNHRHRLQLRHVLERDAPRPQPHIVLP